MATAQLPASHTPVESAPPAPPARPRVVVVATAFAASACLAFFVAAVGLYLTLRSAAGEAWIPKEVHIPMPQPNVMVLALLMSSVTMHWAVWSIKRDDRPHAYLALGVTGIIGFAVLNMAAYLYSLMGLDASASSPMPLLTYLITGAHLLMLVAALIFGALMAFRAMGGQFNARQHDGIAAAEFFWHAQVVVFLFIWYAIYITK